MTLRVLTANASLRETRSSASVSRYAPSITPLLHASDIEMGLLATRYAAGGTPQAAILELQRVLAAFDARPPLHDPLLHVMVVDSGATLPGFSERSLLSAVARNCRVPWWFACVSPSAMVRLAMEIVLLIAPTPALRRVEAFSNEAAAHAWLLSTRPQAHARLLGLVRQVTPADHPRHP